MRKLNDIPDKLMTAPTADERKEIARQVDEGLVMNATIMVPIKAPPWFIAYFNCAYGNRRWMWNHLLEGCKAAYEKDPNWRFDWMRARNDFVVEKRRNEKLSFLDRTACDCYKEPVRDLARAFDKFFKDKYDKNRTNKAGFPTFQKRDRLGGSFRLNGPQTAIEKGVRGKFSSEKCHYLRIPHGDKWEGSPDKWVKLAEPIPYAPLQVLNVTIKRDGTRFFACLAVLVLKSVFKEAHKPNLPNRQFLGIDWGVRSKVTLANPIDSLKVAPFKVTEKEEKHVKSLQRALSRKVHPGNPVEARKGAKPSRNYTKARLRLRKAQRSIKNKRVDAERKLASAIMRTCGAVCIEDTNNKGLMKNHCLAKAIANASPYRFRRNLEWLASWRDGYVEVADRFFPSTRTCSNCGAKKKMKLSEREYRCPVCGMVLDRDVNSGRNLYNRLWEAIKPPEDDCANQEVGRAKANYKATELTALRTILEKDGIATEGFDVVTRGRLE